MSLCKITLDNYKGVYNAGSDIKGKFECTFREDTDIKGIKISMICTEQIQGSCCRSMNTILSGEKICIRSNGKPRKMDKGTYVYPFTFKLPLNVPCTFFGMSGQIIYRIQGLVNLCSSSCHEANVIFLVHAPIQLDVLDQEPLEVIRTLYTTAFACCKMPALTVAVNLSAIGFIPGNVLTCSVDVENHTSLEYEAFFLTLTKIIVYKGNSCNSTKSDEEEIINIVDIGVPGHGSKFYDLELPIPGSTQVPNFVGCVLFDVIYRLRVMFSVLRTKPDGPHIDIDDLFMGHVLLKK